MVGRLVRGLVGLVLVWASVRAPAWAQQPAPSAEHTGTVSGVVLDKGSGEPIIEAGVEVVGTGKTARTDLDGRYTVKVPPGAYQIRIFAPLYQAVRLQNVAVKAGEVTKADAALASSGQAGVETVEVTAKADRAAEATQLAQRKSAAAVSETLSAETIKKTPGADVATIVQRAPAVTVKEGKFLFVRGLGERYSSALLNGSRLPSTDPLKRVVPLDLFPADFLQSLSIVKTYTPDLPGDFSAGLAEIDLRDFPEQLAYNVGLSVNANTQTTFQDFDTYEGSNWDYLGYGNNFRDLPSSVPPGNIGDLPSRQRFSVGRDFRNIWNIDTMTAPPGFGTNFSVGDTIGKFGYQFGAVYLNEYRARQNEIQRIYLNAGDLKNPDIQIRDNFRVNNSTYLTRLGAVLTTAYRPTDDHRFTLRALYNDNSFDNVQVGNGSVINNPEFNQNQRRLRYVEEELGFGQLAGEHRLFPWLNLDWRTAYSRTSGQEPDQRFLTYVGPPGQHGEFVNDSLGGSRIFNQFTERLTDTEADFTVPFTTGLPFTDVWSGLPAKVKFGPAYLFRKRDFEQRRFEYQVPATGLFDLTQPPEVLLQPGNIGPGGFDFIEDTQPRDSYDASQDIYGFYGLLDTPLVQNKLRLIAGVRVENSYILLRTFDTQGFPAKVIKNNTDPLPSVNLVYSPRDDMNLRAGWSQTVSRPEFRELSPTQIPEPRGLFPIEGNPDLVESHITNWDLRWEWFFSPLELLSVSFFDKRLSQPIQNIAIAQSSNTAITFVNAVDAHVIGFELEGRKDFSFLATRLSPRLANLSLLTNLTYASSTSKLTRTPLSVVTFLDNQVTGVAPYIVNIGLDYTDPDWGSYRVLFNRAGSTLALLGTYGLPNIFEEPRNQLDFVASFPLQRFVGAPLTARFAAENILNDEVLFTQGGLVQRQFTTGVKLSFGVTYSH